VKEEAPEKLLRRDSHQLLLALVRIIFPTKRHFPIGDMDDPVVGDSDTMRVAGQVLKNVLWSSKWPFGVNHPVVMEQWPKKSMESLCLGQWFQGAGEHQFALVESALQTSGELATENPAQDLDRKEEGVARMNPLLVIKRQTASWDDAVNMGVKTSSRTIP
jgi:hypothetical protein